MSREAEVNDFEECLKEGIYWEEKLKHRIEREFMTTAADRIAFEDHPDKQRAGIDLELMPDGVSAVDTKVRDYESYKYGDIILETWSVVEENEPGWFYTSEADVIAYAWKNKAGTNLINPGYLITNLDRLRDWYQDNYGNYPHICAKSNDWTTKFRPVPIEDFPDGTLIPFPARLPTGRVTDQATLENLGDQEREEER